MALVVNFVYHPLGRVILLEGSFSRQWDWGGLRHILRGKWKRRELRWCVTVTFHTWSGTGAADLGDAKITGNVHSNTSAWTLSWAPKCQFILKEELIPFLPTSSLTINGAKWCLNRQFRTLIPRTQPGFGDVVSLRKSWCVCCKIKIPPDISNMSR